jgi:hypothetical protein
MKVKSGPVFPRERKEGSMITPEFGSAGEVKRRRMRRAFDFDLKREFVFRWSARTG